MQQQNPSSTQQYIAYLQSLLNTHKIPYLPQPLYNNPSNPPQIPQPTQQQQQPLQTSLKPELTAQLLMRYSRQMLLREIKYDNQLKIMKSRVAVIGSGGIGCPVAMYLSGAGVGRIGLFDSDVVEMTNLHRQIAHKDRNRGRQKTSSLRECLLEINPHIDVQEHSFVTLDSIHELDDYDLIIDGSDNPKCRYLLNDYLMSEPRRCSKLLSGACIGWEAQITCYSNNPQENQKTACYRCLWGDEQYPTGGCASQGVIGMIPGFVGIVLGVEALKILINGSSSLQGHLLTYDGRSCTFRKMKLRNSPNTDCIVCGMNKVSMNEYNYDKHSQCSSNSNQPPSSQIQSISWQEYISNHKNNSILLDVRPQAHFSIVSFLNSINIPYDKLVHMTAQQIKQKIYQKEQNQQNQEQDKEKVKSEDKKIFVSCKTGINSKKAVSLLEKNGIKTTNIIGGINQYGKQFDSNIPLL